MSFLSCMWQYVLGLSPVSVSGMDVEDWSREMDPHCLYQIRYFIIFEETRFEHINPLNEAWMCSQHVIHQL